MRDRRHLTVCLGDPLTLHVVEFPKADSQHHCARPRTMRPTATAQTGPPPAVLAQMVDVLRRHPEVQRAVLFGSRAKGSARPNSDIDLALYGDVPPLVVQSIAHELDELPTPYLFDLQAIEGLQNPALLEHIQRVGIEIYSAAQAHALP